MSGTEIIGEIVDDDEAQPLQHLQRASVIRRDGGSDPAHSFSAKNTEETFTKGRADAAALKT